MAKNQRSYTQEFKQQIVDLHTQAGKGISELSREYGIPKGTIYTWIKNLSPVQVSETETISMKEYKALQENRTGDGSLSCFKPSRRDLHLLHKCKLCRA